MSEEREQVINFKMAIPYNINIEATSNGGFIVKAGCATLCFETSESLLKSLKDYLENPEENEKLYNESNKNRRPEVVPLTSSPGIMGRTTERDQPQCEDECQG